MSAPPAWIGAAAAPWILSVGHSDHDEPAFLALLARHDVSVLVDVRTHPKSHHAHFTKDALAASLARAGIAYHHLPGLGGLGDRDVAAALLSGEGARAYARLKELALAAAHAGSRAVFMCKERDPGDCHRRHIAARLETDGWRVGHILPDAAQSRLF